MRYWKLVLVKGIMAAFGVSAAALLILWAAVSSHGEQPPGKPEPVGKSSVAKPPGTVKPGQVAISKPDANGLVTMLRPLMTQVAVGDSPQIALHWAKADGPIQQFRVGGGDDPDFLRLPTLNSMQFMVTDPDSKRTVLRPKVQPRGTAYSRPMYLEPTYVFTLSDSEIADAVGTSEAAAKRYPHVGPWTTDATGTFQKAGKYQIAVSGSIHVRNAKPIQFSIGPVEMELICPNVKPQAKIVEAALAATVRAYPSVRRDTSYARVVEDGQGNRRVLLSGPADDEEDIFSYNAYSVTVDPGGAVKVIKKSHVSTCIARGTMIPAEPGPRPVESVCVGDRVWGYDTARRAKVLTTVLRVASARARETLTFGGTLRVTPSHPLFASQAWRPAGKVRESDELFTDALCGVPAGAPTRDIETIDVFDLTVAAPHNFFAGGFLVHNKSREYSPALDDRWYILWPGDLSRKDRK